MVHYLHLILLHDNDYHDTDMNTDIDMIKHNIEQKISELYN